MRPLIVAVLAFVVLMMGAVGMALSLHPPVASRHTYSPAVSANAPLTIDCAMEGWFSSGYSWTLKVKPDGLAHLTVGSLRNKPQDFHLSAEQMEELSQVVERERFFDLQNIYGDKNRIECSERRLTITRGKQIKTVILYGSAGDPRHLPEVKRALRVWNAVQATFVDPDAEDLRPYDPPLTEAR